MSRFPFRPEASVDPITPPDAIDAVRVHFAAHPNAEVIIHAGAEHGFSHEGAAWDPDAAAATVRRERGEPEDVDRTVRSPGRNVSAPRSATGGARPSGSGCMYIATMTRR